MAETIRGVTVKIGADTSDFTRSLKKIDKDIKYSEQRARELQNQLQIQYDEKKWQKANKIVQDDLRDTESKAKAIREELQYLEKTSGVNTDAYKKISVELDKTETSAEKLNAELEKLNKIKFDSAFQGINKLSSGLETAAKKTALVSAAAVGAIAGIYKLGSDAATTGANLQDMADRLDISAEALQRYDYIALQSGVETEQLVKSIAKARDAVGTALAGGTNTASKALQTLFGDLSKIPTGTEEAFTAIIEQLSKVEDSTMQAYYANEIFGERLATNLIPLINNGADRLEQLGEEFESIGYLSNEQVQALADFDDELNIMKERLELAKTELGIAMLPIMEQFANLLTDVVVPAIKSLSDWFSNLSEPMQKLITFALLFTTALSPILLIMSKIVGVIPKMITLFGKLNTTVGRLSISFLAISTALGLIAAIFENWAGMNTIQKVISILGVLTTVALGAAIAIGAFHSAWSLGLAVAGIVAGISAVIAAVSSAKKEIGYDVDTSGVSDIESSLNSDFSVPSTSGSGSTYSEDNSQYNITINMNATGDLNYDAEELANAVIKKIVVAKQSSGR